MAKGIEGTVIAGRYELASRLGQGTYTTVWKAREIETGGDVAIKILNPPYADDPGLVEELISEARGYMAFRDNPRIATILDCGQDLDTDLTYVAMELYPATLDGVIRGSGALPIEAVLRLAEDLGGALRTVHRAGLVHRDIKSTDILTVPGENRFVLSDFGLGMFDRDDRDAPTMDLSRVGGWAYAAPERIRATGKSEVGPSADIYSAGVVLYRAATGRYPFTSRFPQIMDDHQSTTPPDPRGFRPDLPAPLAELILRCLRKSPAERFASADEMIAAAQEAGTIPPTRPAIRIPVRPILLGLGAVAALGLLVLLVVTLLPGGLEAEIDSRPEGAAFRLYAGDADARFDAIESGTTPARVNGLEEREYTVVVEKEGFFPKEASFTPSSGSSGPGTIVLESSVTVEVVSRPAGASASLRPLGGEDVVEGGPTPTEIGGLRAGPHELVLRLHGYATLVDTVLIGRDGGSFERSLLPGDDAELADAAALQDAASSGDRAETADAAASRGGDSAPSVRTASSGTITEREARDASGAAASDRLDRLAASIPEKIRRGEWDAAERELAELLRERPDEPKAETWRRRIEAGREELRAHRAEAETRERPHIEGTLEAYRQSLEQRDVKQFARLWVSLPARELQDFEAGFEKIESQAVEIVTSNLEVEGNQATLRFHEKRRVRPKSGSDVVSARDRVMKLRRIGNGEWLIASLE